MNRRMFVVFALFAAALLGCGLMLYQGTSQAGVRFISGHVAGAGGSAGTSWATWNETSEGGWGDSANVFIVLFDNPADGTNEYGQGAGLAGADLTFTQVGNLTGASGSPLKRPTYDGKNSYFEYTQNLWGRCTGTQWTVIIKTWDFGTAGAGTYNYLLKHDSSHIDLGKNAGNAFANFNGSEVAMSSNPGASGAVWLVAQRKDPNNTWAGWHTSRPTTKAMCSGTATHASSFSPSTAVGTLGSGVGGGNYLASKLQYIIFSKVALLTE